MALNCLKRAQHSPSHWDSDYVECGFAVNVKWSQSQDCPGCHLPYPLLYEGCYLPRQWTGSLGFNWAPTKSSPGVRISYCWLCTNLPPVNISTYTPVPDHLHRHFLLLAVVLCIYHTPFKGGLSLSDRRTCDRSQLVLHPLPSLWGCWQLGNAGSTQLITLLTPVYPSKPRPPIMSWVPSLAPPAN